MPDKWKRRDQKQKAKKSQMPKHGRSLLNVIEVVILKKAEIAKKKRKKKNVKTQ